MDKTINIVWGGRGKRILGPAEGYSQTYTWDGPGAVAEVKQEDALRVLTEPRAQFTCVNPTDLASLEADVLEQPPATARGRIKLTVGVVAADTEWKKGEVDPKPEVGEQPHLPPLSTGPPPKHPVADRRGAKRKKPKADADA